jgi:hypothetical protein
MRRRRSRPSGETVIHLINHSGHQERSFHTALPIFDIDLALALSGDLPETARALVAGEDLTVEQREGRAQLRLPRLDDFEVIVLG